jgi:hypothetical protein
MKVEFAQNFDTLTKLNMKGINFIIDEQGEKKAVVIDLEQWAEVWDDFYDVLVSRSREDEEEIDWEDLKQDLALEKTKSV